MDLRKIAENLAKDNGYFPFVITKTSVAKFIIIDNVSYTVIGGHLPRHREYRFLLCLACLIIQHLPSDCLPFYNSHRKITPTSEEMSVTHIHFIFSYSVLPSYS